VEEVSGEPGGSPGERPQPDVEVAEDAAIAEGSLTTVPEVGEPEAEAAVEAPAEAEAVAEPEPEAEAPAEAQPDAEAETPPADEAPDRPS
jgi:DNA segregation ATPase FtsK/SpoIIIE, S-DNA-T family